MAHDMEGTMASDEGQSSGDETLPATHHWLSFELSDKRYALPVAGVIEVIANPEITTVPGSYEHILGLVNLRGQIVTVLDIRGRLGLTVKARGVTNRVIMTDIDGTIFGLWVDEIADVLAFDEAQVQTITTDQNYLASAVVEDVTVRLLNLPFMLTSEE